MQKLVIFLNKILTGTLLASAISIGTLLAFGNWTQPSVMFQTTQQLDKSNLPKYIEFVIAADRLGGTKV